MNRVYIKTYGCQMNERDSEAVAAMLRAKGYALVDNELEADVVLLNTCSVRDQAEQKAIGKAGHLAKRKRKNPNFIIGVMGCMAQNRGGALLDSLPDLDLIIGTQKFHRVPDHLTNMIATLQGQGPRPTSIVDLEEEADSQNTIKSHSSDTRQVTAFVSIMQGCNMKCSYCIVPKTRGVERGRPMDEIIDEVKKLAANGTREVTLLGQIVNQYGIREFPFVDKKSPFVQLLEKVHEIEGIDRIRFTSPHPVGFKQDLIDCYGRLPKLVEYIHFPMQSGSNRILKAMRRPYTIEKFHDIITKLRAVRPDMYISTDIIVGFPGETEEDFELTRQHFEEVGFDMAYLFKYSVRPGTTAEPLGDPITKEQKEERNQILLESLRKSSLARNESLVGKVEDVLFEGPAKKGENMFQGRTPGNRLVLVRASARLVGQIVPVRFTRVTASTLFGELVLEGVEEEAIGSVTTEV
ncbi:MULTISPECIES: tRNA (N6-isopentenyl adenosine(37)-C2)-methylthiotransferase MiaB [unclassified Lentimonas]|uniref:tRNA (N6-isopentenyl adenosine(37)-C2)-methylthiotransferase MiaB n=1 Tax=unclassified Lentimonas TaxID=2630993 RepID=UPI00132B4121|nr:MULTISPECIES: tRNA (N6-isopentenyl adenosine(37)-C2)-methylthiotransferase MiaB [unclassified Lentimonas]CAA6676396.1 tRNA-i(6)A37 methylthiotransferase [Lentimonas sp. CC4]CAA6685235.1 tRNA-i(6)A37 methylthiotransferase [Lentimonas sp. CC6]CAA6693424.1 tRNA-i(6)A37 methylthiotransferase [Lentimonas sp. CC19]CAA6696466.1 tRNA-i(6)A37 methylthiotransferase [Lentimonas sp. CC10]CAA7072369.1 tRNA-i(6)A37 methylthiotransferase [Lentimonas sp. CC11]